MVTKDDGLRPITSSEVKSLESEIASYLGSDNPDGPDTEEDTLDEQNFDEAGDKDLDDQDDEDGDEDFDEDEDEDFEPEKKKKPKKPDDIEEKFWTGDEIESYKKQALAYKEAEKNKTQTEQRMKALFDRLGVSDDVEAAMAFADADFEADMTEGTERIKRYFGTLYATGQISEQEMYARVGTETERLRTHLLTKREVDRQQANDSVLLKVKEQYGDLIQAEPDLKAAAGDFIGRSLEAGEILDEEMTMKVFDYWNKAVSIGEERGYQRALKEHNLQGKKQKIKSKAKSSVNSAKRTTQSAVPSARRLDDNSYRNLTPEQRVQLIIQEGIRRSK